MLLGGENTVSFACQKQAGPSLKLLAYLTPGAFTLRPQQHHAAINPSFHTTFCTWCTEKQARELSSCILSTTGRRVNKLLLIRRGSGEFYILFSKTHPPALSSPLIKEWVCALLFDPRLISLREERNRASSQGILHLTSQK